HRHRTSPSGIEELLLAFASLTATLLPLPVRALIVFGTDPGTEGFRAKSGTPFLLYPPVFRRDGGPFGPTRTGRNNAGLYAYRAICSARRGRGLGRNRDRRPEGEQAPPPPPRCRRRRAAVRVGRPDHGPALPAQRRRPLPSVHPD